MQRIAFELEQIQAAAGPSEDKALQSIAWETDHTFSSGVRAPPWRHAKGELCYLIAETLDVGRIVITCTTEGYFRNQGYFFDTGGMMVDPWSLTQWHCTHESFRNRCRKAGL
jgi:hypothetical protein